MGSRRTKRRSICSSRWIRQRLLSCTMISSLSFCCSLFFFLLWLLKHFASGLHLYHRSFYFLLFSMSRLPILSSFTSQCFHSNRVSLRRRREASKRLPMLVAALQNRVKYYMGPIAGIVGGVLPVGSFSLLRERKESSVAAFLDIIRVSILTFPFPSAHVSLRSVPFSQRFAFRLCLCAVVYNVPFRVHTIRL